MDQPTHRRSGCSVIAVFALVGLVDGIYTYMILDPLIVSIGSPAPPSGNASLEVIFFERVRYLRIAPDTLLFRLEVALWQWGPPVLTVFSGVLGGGLIGYLTNRCLRRAPWRINT